MIRELFRQLGLIEEKKRKNHGRKFIRQPGGSYSKEEWKAIKKMSRDYGRVNADLLRDYDRDK